MNVTIFGSGYIGCVVAAGLAECGHSVSLFTRHPKEWEKKGGVPRFYEPELEEVWERQRALGRLSLTSDMTSDVPKSDVVMFCLGTPARDDGKCDTDVLMEAINKVGKFMRPGAVLAVKSTVPVGTCRKIEDEYEYTTTSIRVVSNPEFLREGSALKEFRSGKGIVVGARTEEAFEVMRKLYQPVLNGETIAEMSPESAEFTKLASNSLLAIKVAAGNELSAAAEALGADFRDVAASLKQNPNIGGYGLIPGPGIGGSC
ncbi:MAG: nucleotide sugar dehydrogenase, partial [Candidatus Dadabacteria bacterium]|nr:nucleotide sugar dehydrogenase [Candidatus Dadabacteria bacterium]